MRNDKHSGSVRLSMRRLCVEPLEERRMLSMVSYDWDTVLNDENLTLSGIRLRSGVGGLAASELGTITPSYWEMHDTAFSITNKLYGVSFSNTLMTSGLYEITISPMGSTNPTVFDTQFLTNLYTPENHRVDLDALEFDDEGILYGAGTDRSLATDWVFEIDPASGVATPIAEMLIDTTRYSTSLYAGDIEFDSHGNLYLSTVDGELLKMRTGTTTLEVLGDTGYHDIAGLTYDRTNRLLGFRSNSVSSGRRVVRIGLGDARTTDYGDLPPSIDRVYGAATILHYTLPNLTGYRFDVESTALNASETFTVEYQVENTRPGDSGGFLIDFFISTDTTFGDPDDILLGSDSIDALGPSAISPTQSIDLTAPPSSDSFWLGEGTYYLGMVVDPTNEVYESDEDFDNQGQGSGLDYEAVPFSLPNALPTITSISSTPDPVLRPNMVTLFAHQVDDPDGSVESVAFYREANGEAGLQTGTGGDTLVGIDTTSAGWLVVFDTAGVSSGTHTYYAQAIDNQGLGSAEGLVAASTTHTITNLPPSIMLLNDGPDPITRPDNLALIASSVSDPDGTVASVAFYRETNSTVGLQIGLDGDTLIATDADPAQGWSITVLTDTLPAGIHRYYGLATDNDGGTSNVDELAQWTENTIVNLMPSIATLSATPEVVEIPNDLTLLAEAIDPDGTVSLVAFYRESNDIAGLQIGLSGDTLFGIDEQGADGWSLVVLTLELATEPHTFYARALDNDLESSVVGASTLSVSSTVESPPPCDFGDAPDATYPTLLASDGARHIIVSDFYLGALADVDLEGQPNADASGDDLNGDDEDGVVLDSIWIPGDLAHLSVTATAAGKLDAWVDFNGDGIWSTGEQVFYSLPIDAGSNALIVSVPETAHFGTTFARFRFSSEGGLDVTGLANDGEVEDYQVTIGRTILVGNTLHVVGDHLDNVFTFSITGTDFTVDIDGQSVSYLVDLIDTVTFDGALGNDTALIHGTSANETADLRPGSAEFMIDGVTVNVLDTETITLDGGGGTDQIVWNDSAGEDRLKVWPEQLTAKGEGYTHQADNFETVFAYANQGGTDYVKLYDTPGNDTYKGWPTVGLLQGDNYSARVKNFDHVLVYSRPGDSDTAFLYDSQGNDRLKMDSDKHFVYLRGEGFHHRVKNFDEVQGFSSEGGIDRAVFKGHAADEVFRGASTMSEMTGPDYHVGVWDYEKVVGRGLGGFDQAWIDGTDQADRFRFRAKKAMILGRGFQIVARNFDIVYADGKGGNDKGYLLDSKFDDHLSGEGDTVRLERKRPNNSWDAVYEMMAIEQILAFATTGTNTTDIDTVSVSVTLDGPWT